MGDRWRVLVTALVLAMALGVAGCGDDEEEPAAGGLFLCGLTAAAGGRICNYWHSQIHLGDNRCRKKCFNQFINLSGDNCS